MSEASFEIHVHERERVIEVKYPTRLTPEALADYRAALEAAVLRLGASWRCLVDQTRLEVIPPHLTDGITALNRWAATHGLVAAARVLKQTAVGELQTRRILRESGLGESGKVYFDRDEAWRHLVG
ncbi:MAG: hypothetical protein INH41_10245 [Myxococcaceae bacterium]|jgi:hypothetical protein|nr:hypothetical protein [Myxococcaceae bacterium]MCA3012763.1 hypothetical protein [Myxococcaceae bacterium]